MGQIFHMTCKFCQKEFVTSRRLVGYCSNQCFGKSRRIDPNTTRKRTPANRSVSDAICTSCNKPFLVSDFSKQRGGGKLCRKCITIKAGKESRKRHPWTGPRNNNWKGGVTADLVSWLKQWKKKHRQKTIVKYKARDAARYAVKCGLIVKTPCEDCGATLDIQAHHEDYSKPLDVIWLCRTCHNKRHGKLQNVITNGGVKCSALEEKSVNKFV